MNKLTVAEGFSIWAPEWVQGLTGFGYDFAYNVYKCFVFDDRYKLMITGLGNTLQLTFFALLLGIVIGVAVSIVRVSWDKNGQDMHGASRLLLGAGNIVSTIYLTVIRGTPVVVQILILNFVVFATSRNKLLVGVIAFGINSGAYIAEIIRGGIMSIDRGQMEAGRSLGLNYVRTMWYIIIPQAVKNVLPALGNEFIVLLKETAIVGYIGLSDITYASNIIGGVTYVYFYPLLAAAVIYLIMVMVFSWLVGRLERRLRSSDH